MRRAGLRRDFIELQAQVTAGIPTGFSGKWVTYGRAWAEVRPSEAAQTERAIAHTTDAAISHLVECDYRDDVKTSHRVRLEDGTCLYVVGAPQNVERRNKTLVIACEERAA